MHQIIARIRLPFGANRDQWGAAIDRELTKIWIEIGNVQPAKARALYRLSLGKAQKRVSLPSQREMLILDEIIIAQAVTLGWRIMTSQLVILRCSRWSDELFVPKMFERFGKVLARSVRILSGAEAPPIDDPGLRDYKRAAVPELRILLREMRSLFHRCSPEPSSGELAEWFLTAVADNKRFPKLGTNILHWALFLGERENAGILKLELTGHMAAASVFDSWLAYFKRHDAEYLRKSLSRLRSSR
jgi:hypothetical protein